MLIDILTRELEALGAHVTTALEPDLGGIRPDAVIDVIFEGAERRFLVEARARAPYPSELHQLEHVRSRIGQLGTPLLVAPYVSEALGAILIPLGWSWADAHGNYDLAASPWRLRNRTLATAPSRSGSGFPKSPAGLKIVRALIASPRPFGDRLSQARLAAAAGVTQPRVSQILDGLEREDLVERQGRELRWQRESLWEAFVDRYAGPGGDERHAYALDPLVEVALALMDSVEPASAAISADVGADLVAPSRRPTHLIVYYRSGVPPDLEPAGLVPTDSRDGANVTLVAPSDDSVFGPNELPTVRAIGERRLRLADPTQITWDLIRLGGRDRDEAAEAMKRWMLSSSR